MTTTFEIVLTFTWWLDFTGVTRATHSTGPRNNTPGDERLVVRRSVKVRAKTEVEIGQVKTLSLLSRISRCVLLLSHTRTHTPPVYTLTRSEPAAVVIST